jgi:hypothetical protein
VVAVPRSAVVRCAICHESEGTIASTIGAVCYDCWLENDTLDEFTEAELGIDPEEEYDYDD